MHIMYIYIQKEEVRVYFCNELSMNKTLLHEESNFL